MATVKVKFRASSVDTKEGTLYYQVIHNRIVRQIKTDYHIHAGEWNEKNSEITTNAPAGSNRDKYLLSLQKRINNDIKAMEKIASKLLDEGIYVTGFYYPVVPKGQARIRVQVSAGHEKSHLDKCVAAFTKVGRELGVIK